MGSAEGVSERIHKFVVENFPLARKKTLKTSDPLLESGVVDSLGILDLVSFIEKEFSIRVSDEDLLPENFQSVESVTAFVGKKKATQTNSPGWR